MVAMRRFRVGVHVELVECEFEMIHKHKTTGRVLEFGDSRIDAFKEFALIEKEVLKLLGERGKDLETR
jgi:hypothetical protein